MNVHKMMKQYAREILNVKDRRQISTVTLFRTLGWLPIDVRIRYFTSIVMYNVMHGHAPGYLTALFVLNQCAQSSHSQLHKYSCEEIQPVLRPAHICLQGCETLGHDPGMYKKCE